jgi:NAD(P)-dependent dehydrogenase (short-subunit alcohol dehydrogenase family)
VTFRAGLLDGRRLAVGGGDGDAIPVALRGLGAWVDSLSDQVVLADDAVAAWVSERLPLHGLVFDARASFGHGGRDGLTTALRLAWLITRAVSTGALIAGDRPGKVTLIAPSPAAGPHAEAARAGVENLARTLSVEWARFGVTSVAICPGTEPSEKQIAELVCFLHCPAGEYFSGCRFDLGAALTGSSMPIGPPANALRAS